MQPIIIYGQTASGKSALAMQLAKQHNGAIINADAMQLYQHLSILSALPSHADTQLCPHYMYGILPPTDYMDAATWVRHVSNITSALIQQHITPIICGGTGFYIKALLHGLSPLPAISDTDKTRVKQQRQHDLKAVYDVLMAADPTTTQKIHPNDSYRLWRNITIYDVTGHHISYYYNKPSIKLWNYTPRIIHHQLPKDTLHQRIEERVTYMVQQGAITQIAQLLQRNITPNAPIYRIIGAEHALNYCRNIISLNSMIELIIKDTKHYAKRQKTFFNHQL